MRWLRQLGRGATAEAWLVSRFGRLSVAKKGDPELLSREARLAAPLRHRNIARVHGMRDGVLFMEYVDGCDLRTLLKNLDRAPAGFAAFVVAEVCRALDHAHQRGLIHRDVSPANILVSRRGAVKLTDFGVARDEAGNGTNTGSLRGNLAYMSPEQLDGQKVDLRADLFAAGVVLHECARVKRLWKGLDLVTMKAARSQPIPPLEDATLDAICKKALAAEFGSAGEMARALEQKEFGRKELAALVPARDEPSRVTRTQAPTRKRRYLLVAVAAVAIASAVALLPREKKLAPALLPPVEAHREQQIIVIDGPQPQKRPHPRAEKPEKIEKKSAPHLSEGQLLDPFHR
jgi:serine/threonine-protein kinase